MELRRYLETISPVMVRIVCTQELFSGESAGGRAGSVGVNKDIAAVLRVVHERGRT